MKLINKFLIILVVTTIFYTFVLQLEVFWYAVAEVITLGAFILFLSFCEAMAIRDCEKEYADYKKRQEKLLLDL